MKIPSSEELMKQIRITIEVAWRNGLELSMINKWLENFTGEALGSKKNEENLALWMLYNFTYFNEEEVKHLCKLLLKKYLHIALQDKAAGLGEINNVLKNSKFVPLGRSSESGAYVLYLFRQENDLPVIFFGDDLELRKDQSVVFIDDMTLSGNQALKKIQKIKYAGYKITELDIRDEFVCKLQQKEQDQLTKYIKEHLNCNKSDKQALAETITSRVIKNKSFYMETQGCFEENTFSECLKEIVEKYRRKDSDIDDIIIYKMNRLLLEHYYGEAIRKGINNTEVQKYYLLSFIASEKAKQKLENENVNVINCIEIDEAAEVFSEVSMVFGNYQEEKLLCKNMCEYYGKKLKPDYPLGYNNCQYLFGLYYTIPNNTLPIFWATENWNPLFIRHEKNYGGEVKDAFGKYI